MKAKGAIRVCIKTQHKEVSMQTFAQSIHIVEAVDMSRLRRKACLAAAPALAQA
jgi:hypothetical protein